MNVFDRVIQRLGLSLTSQGSGNEYSWAYALLNTASVYETAHPTADTLTDDFDEVLLRLAPIRTSFAGQRLAQMFARVK